MKNKPVREFVLDRIHTTSNMGIWSGTGKGIPGIVLGSAVGVMGVVEDISAVVAAGVMFGITEELGSGR